MNDNSPVQNNGRIAFLDILRGIAIFFIFVANIFVLSGWYFLNDSQVQSLGNYHIDKTLEFLQIVFVQGKFYSVFSILFGIGFVIQFDKFKESDNEFTKFFSIRMLGLFFIGLLHLCLLWNGDILTLYALLGFTLIYFKNQTDKQLVLWAAMFISLPIFNLIFIYSTGLYYFQILFEMRQSYIATIETLPKDIFLPVYLIQTEHIDEVLRINLGNIFGRFGYFLFEGRQFKVLGCFLIGVLAGRRILYDNLLNEANRLKRISIYGLIIGIPVNLILSLTSHQDYYIWTFTNAFLYSIGVPALACGYASLIAMVHNSKPSVLKIFEPVGRMALTNYLLQTIISILLFYGIGFGLGTKINLIQAMLILILIFMFQIGFSWLWLKYFNYGPTEWIWRQMTYGKLLSIRKKG